VRQASLAPQLKDGVQPPAGEAPQPDAADGRTPAESRALMESLQRGWQRARAEAGPPDDCGAPAGSPERAAMPEDRQDM
jgi:hypothetical protein